MEAAAHSNNSTNCIDIDNNERHISLPNHSLHRNSESSMTTNFSLLATTQSSSLSLSMAASDSATEGGLGGGFLQFTEKALSNYQTDFEYLVAMTEDLADWFNSLYDDLQLNLDNFFQSIENGVVLCRHAEQNAISPRHYEQILY